MSNDGFIIALGSKAIRALPVITALIYTVSEANLTFSSRSFLVVGGKREIIVPTGVRNRGPRIACPRN